MESFAFGAVISNSSSTVISKVLLERGELETSHARLSIAWSSVQDISTVLLVAVFSMLTPGAGDGAELVSILEGAAFLFVIVPAALWFLPWLFGRAAVSGSRAARWRRVLGPRRGPRRDLVRQRAGLQPGDR